MSPREVYRRANKIAAQACIRATEYEEELTSQQIRKVAYNAAIKTPVGAGEEPITEEEATKIADDKARRHDSKARRHDRMY